MSNDTVFKYEEFIKRTLKGYDASLKNKGQSFTSILNEIDMNTSIDCKSITHKVNILINILIRKLGRTKHISILNWLINNQSYILKLVIIYKCLKSNVYSIDSSFLEYCRSNSNIDFAPVLNNSFNDFVIVLDNFVYFVNEKQSDDNKVLEIGVVTRDSLIYDDLVTYSFEFNVTKPDVNNTAIATICNNDKCPRYKQSLQPRLSDGGKTLVCSYSDCNSCGFFKECNMLKPDDLVSVIKGIYYCMTTREHSHSSTSSKEYEHIPKPLRMDEIIIQFGVSQEPTKTYGDLGLLDIDKYNDKCALVNSHASPREHHRRGGIRRGYIRQDGIKVKETTFKDTIVNKGLTKATYRFKNKDS